MWAPRGLRRGGPLYLALADALQADIEKGRLAAGARLPPQRELAARIGVDFTTVTRAYAEARRRGLIAGHVGRGTFVRPRSELPVARAFLGALSASDSPRGDVVDLSLNLPPREVTEQAERALQETLREMSGRGGLAGLLEYQPNAGREAHRAAGAEWIAQRGMAASADRVVVCAGAQHALTVLLMTLVKPGQTVLTESLTYPGFKALAKQMGIELYGLPMDAEGLLVGPFRAACAAGRSRVLYTNPTLQNPTSAVMSAERRRAIADVARRYDVTIIEDDVSALQATGAPPPIASLVPDQSYYIASLAKAVAPGLRVAFVVTPSAQAAGEQATMIGATIWMAVTLTAEVAARWVRDGTAGQLSETHRVEASARQRMSKQYLERFGWVGHPESSHGWLVLPRGWSSAEFVLQAKRRQVLVTPAEAFAVGPERPPAAVRLGLCAARERQTLDNALARLARILESGPGVAAPVL